MLRCALPVSAVRGVGSGWETGVGSEGWMRARALGQTGGVEGLDGESADEGRARGTCEISGQRR